LLYHKTHLYGVSFINESNTSNFNYSTKLLEEFFILFFYLKGRGYAPKHNKEKKKVKALGKTMALLLAKESKMR
jgi:hypothetical protein